MSPPDELQQQLTTLKQKRDELAKGRKILNAAYSNVSQEFRDVNHEIRQLRRLIDARQFAQEKQKTEKLIAEQANQSEELSALRTNIVEALGRVYELKNHYPYHLVLTIFALFTENVSVDGRDPNIGDVMVCIQTNTVLQKQRDCAAFLRNFH